MPNKAYPLRRFADAGGQAVRQSGIGNRESDSGRSARHLSQRLGQRSNHESGRLAAGFQPAGSPQRAASVIHSGGLRAISIPIVTGPRGSA